MKSRLSRSTLNPTKVLMAAVFCSFHYDFKDSVGWKYTDSISLVPSSEGFNPPTTYRSMDGFVVTGNKPRLPRFAEVMSAA